MIIAFFGLKAYFVNAVAGYEGYVHRGVARYIRVSAKKPVRGKGAAAGEGKKAR
jgi:hypothetical protein